MWKIEICFLFKEFCVISVEIIIILSFLGRKWIMCYLGFESLFKIIFVLVIFKKKMKIMIKIMIIFNGKNKKCSIK